MGTIGLTLLIFCLALAALIYLSNIYTRYCLTHLVVRKIEWLDFVQDTALVPPDWRARHEKAINKLPSGDEIGLQRLKGKARNDYLRRMDKLIQFARVCTLIPNEAERARIIKDLESIRQDWSVNDDALFTSAR